MTEARILVGDVRERLLELADGSVRCCVTSPPYYGLRDYGVGGQIGLEASPDGYVDTMVAVFRQVRRVLADDGTLWLNLGDSYSSHDPGGVREGEFLNTGGRPPAKGQARNRAGTHVDGLRRKNLIGIPWRVAFALQADGWYLRQDIIWAKPNPMPESVRDRCTKSHEYLFLLSKSPRYFYDQGAIAEPLADSSVTRLAQDVDAQAGSDRVPGKTNGPMGAVAPASWRGSSFDTGKTAEHQLGRAQPAGRRLPRFGGAKYGDSDDPKHATKSGNEWEPTGYRNKRDVWTIASQPFAGAHFAVMPEALAEPCVLAGSAEGDTVLDPFAGSGTVGVVALRHQRNFVGVELNPDYAAMARERIAGDAPLLNVVAA